MKLSPVLALTGLARHVFIAHLRGTAVQPASAPMYAAITTARSTARRRTRASRVVPVARWSPARVARPPASVRRLPRHKTRDDRPEDHPVILVRRRRPVHLPGPRLPQKAPPRDQPWRTATGRAQDHIAARSPSARPPAGASTNRCNRTARTAAIGALRNHSPLSTHGVSHDFPSSHRTASRRLSCRLRPVARIWRMSHRPPAELVTQLVEQLTVPAARPTVSAAATAAPASRYQSPPPAAAPPATPRRPAARWQVDDQWQHHATRQRQRQSTGKSVQSGSTIKHYDASGKQVGKSTVNGNTDDPS